MHRVRRTVTSTGWLLAVVALLLIWTSAAQARSHTHRHGRPAIKVTAKPAVVTAGADAAVTGKVNGVPKRARKSFRVELQQKGPNAFSRIGSSKLTRKGAFSLRYRAPATPTTVSLRLRVLRGKHTVVVSKTWKLQVRAAGGGLVPGPTDTHRTQVLSPASVEAAPAPGAAGQLRVSGAPNLAPGDFVAVGIGSSTPYGFLGRVTGVHPGDGFVIVDTTPTTLVEAVPEGAIEQHLDGGELDTASGRRSAVAHGPSTRASSATAGFVRHVHTAVSCSAGASVTVDGNVAINPHIDISAGWSPFSGVSARFVGHASASAELSASADASADCSFGPHVLFTKTLNPIEFSVGPVPVVIIPKLTVYLSASGKVEATVSTEVHGSVDASAGLEYKKGDVKPVAAFDHGFGYTPPDPAGSAELGATISPTLDLMFYGVAGPEVAFNVGLQLDADPEASPSWKLTAPVSLTAKLTVPILKIDTGNWTVYQHSFLLAEEGDSGLQGFIHFDEFPTGTPISTEYADEGVVFDSDTFITDDGSNPTSPVLSGTPQFQGPVTGHFVVPGTDTATTVNRLQLDAGYIDNPGSIEIVATLRNGDTRTAVADHLGIDQISIATRGIESFTVQPVDDEPAGFAIDNLDFGQ